MPDDGQSLQKRFSAGSLPESYAVGERLRAASVNTIIQAMREMARMGVGLGGDMPIERPQRVKARNASGGAIAAYQMVEVTDSVLNNPEQVIEINTPSADSVELTAITTQPIANGACGWVWICGIALVEYAGVVATGDRLGSQNGSTVAAADEISAWIVLGVTIIDATNYALVRFQPGGIAGAGEIILRLNGNLPGGVTIDIPSDAKIGSVEYLGLDVDGKMILNFTTECYKVVGTTTTTTTSSSSSSTSSTPP